MREGIIIGAILVLGLFNNSIGIPVLILFLIFFSKKIGIDKSDIPIVFLLVMKMIWIISIFLLFKNNSIFNLFQTLGVDLMMLIVFLTKRDEIFYKGFFISIAILFSIDLAFNIWTLFFGADPLGRVASLRPGDISLRLGGIFYHPFYSINISFVTLLFAMYLRNRLILFLCVLNIVMNGSFRGSLTLIIFSIVFFLLKWRVRFSRLFIISIVLAATVFLITIFSVGFTGEISGNFYRVFAWSNAIENILQHPMIGTHSFSTDELPSINEDTIKEFGIAESTYLGYALHYGIFPMFVHFLLITFIFWRRLKLFYSNISFFSHDFKFIAAVFSSVVFIDTFYGTLLGSMLTTMCYGLMCVSNREIRKSELVSL